MSRCKYCKKNIANTLFCSSLCVTDFAEKFDKLDAENKKLKGDWSYLRRIIEGSIVEPTIMKDGTLKVMDKIKRGDEFKHIRRL